MKSITFCLFLIAFTAFGQKVEKMNPRAAAEARAGVSFPVPNGTPSLSDGGLVVESEPNGVGRKVWLVVTQPGTYLLQGRTCNGDEVRLGELHWETNPYHQTLSAMVYDGEAMIFAAPFFPQVCTVEVLRVDSGRIERSWNDVNPWFPAPTTKLQIGADGIGKDGRYFVSVSSLPSDAVVIIGRSAVGEVQSTPFGSVITLPEGVHLPPAGTTTLTVCTEGRCETTTYERKFVVSPSSGKG